VCTPNSPSPFAFFVPHCSPSSSATRCPKQLPLSPLLPEVTCTGNFCGIERRSQVEKITERLLSSPSSQTVIVGPVGIGKTHLLEKVSYNFVTESVKQGWRAQVKIFSAQTPDRLWEKLIGFCQRSLEYEKSEINPDLHPSQLLPQVIAADLENGYRWLLCFDDATNRDVIQAILEDPCIKNRCHVIITAQEEEAWADLPLEHLHPVEVAESVEWIRSGIGYENSENNFENLAERLGNIPQAHNLACAHIQKTGISIPEYLRDSDPALDPISFAAKKTLNFLKEQNPNAYSLLQILAIFGPWIPQEELQGLSRIPEFSEFPILFLNFKLVKQSIDGSVEIADFIIKELEPTDSIIIRAKQILGSTRDDEESFATFLNQQAIRYREENEFVKSLALTRRLLGFQMRLGCPPLDLSATLWALGNHMLLSERPTDALPFFMEAYNLRKKEFPPDNLETAQMLLDIGYSLESMGQDPCQVWQQGKFLLGFFPLLSSSSLFPLPSSLLLFTFCTSKN
jgi:hypothetical protein